MKTKLPLRIYQNTKSTVKCRSILSFLFILFMTVSSVGQSDGIVFTCEGDGDISFNTPPDDVFNGKDSWSNGTDGTNSGYTLRFEADNTWSVRAPGTPGPRFFYSELTGNLPSCNSSDWILDTDANGQFCNGVIVVCTPSNDPDNDGDGYNASIDCNDNDASINPGVAEICDGIDNNCDGNIDEGLESQGCFVYEYCGDVEKENKVVICHKGKDICVSMNAIDAHLAHGDTLGSCSAKSSNRGKGSLEELPTSYDVVFWPNPSNNNFNVKMITPNVTEKVSVETFDINGRLIHANIINGNENYQFGNNLSAGIYIVKLTQASTTKMIKIVKQ